MSMTWGRTRPTRHELLNLKKRLELAERSHDLLEEKYKMLNAEAQELSNLLIPLEREAQDRFGEAYERLRQALRSLGPRALKRMAASSRAQGSVDISWSALKGVPVPRMTVSFAERRPTDRGYDLLDSNFALDAAARSFERAVASLLRSGDLRNSAEILRREADSTWARVGALERIVIPALRREVKRIKDRLEERERTSSFVVREVLGRGSQAMA